MTTAINLEPPESTRQSGGGEGMELAAVVADERPTFVEPDRLAGREDSQVATASNPALATNAASTVSPEISLGAKIPELLDFFPKSLRNRR